MPFVAHRSVLILYYLFGMLESKVGFERDRYFWIFRAMCLFTYYMFFGDSVVVLNGHVGFAKAGGPHSEMLKRCPFFFL